MHCSSWLIGKLLINFLFVLIELRVFALGVMAEALRAIIDQKSAIVKVVGQFRPIFFT